MLTHLFKTKDRITLLRYVLYHPPFTVQEVADATGVSKGLVSRFLARLVTDNLLAKKERTFQSKDTILTRTIKVLLNVSFLEPFIPLPGWIKGIGIYGSWGEGTNTVNSDLDLWVYVDMRPHELDLARLQRLIKKKIGTEVQILVLTKEKIKELQVEDIPFTLSLLRTMIVIRGESPVLL